MKKVYPYDDDNETFYVCYQDADIKELNGVLWRAKHLWNEEWYRQGRTDEGTCTGGKGITVDYIGPRKRNPTRETIVPAPGVQGNLSAARSVGPALDYLEKNGVIGAKYYDGWMD